MISKATGHEKHNEERACITAACGHTKRIHKKIRIHNDLYWERLLAANHFFSWLMLN